MTRRITTHLVLLIAVIATIGCDQVTKHMATSTLSGAPGRSYLSGVVRMEFTENTGGFLGLGSNLAPAARTVLFTGATGVMLAGVIVMAFRERLKGLALLGVALFVAGGASNWIDRFANGRVVDFLIVDAGVVRTGVFNVADMALLLGCALFLLAQFREVRETGQTTVSHPSDRG